ALATTQDADLDAKTKHLSMDGKVHLEDKDGIRIITFLQYQWDIDNSFAFVYLAPAQLPKSSAAQEQWSKSEELAPGWYLVEGT
ncbi:MAG: hypothetical protein K8R88_14720, partial [Armatimonadetes bacterium]|nr:hypothetical protein [Armatimonadota bacterium]